MFNNPFGMVVGIVAVVVLAGVLKEYLDKRGHSNLSEDELDAIDQRLQRLEDRLTNIETIVTSKDYHLDKEFEELSRQG